MTILNYIIEDGKVHIKEFSSEGAVFYPLDKSYESRASLEEIGATNIDRKIELWGTRGENEQPLRVFVVKDMDANSAGYVNLGVNDLIIDGKTLLEGGALFKAEYNGNAAVASSLNAVYNDYLKALYNDNAITAPAFIYTVTKDNPLYVSLQQSELTELTISDSDIGMQCIVKALETNLNRFAVDYDNNIVAEEGLEKAVFFNILDSNACSSIEISGATLVNDAEADL